VATKTTKLTGPEIKLRREAAEKAAGYGSPEKTLIAGKTTEVICQTVYDLLLVADLDAAKLMLSALRKREIANRLTFHPETK